jgi:hypothetical protein
MTLFYANLDISSVEKKRFKIQNKIFKCVYGNREQIIECNRY